MSGLLPSIRNATRRAVMILAYIVFMAVIFSVFFTWSSGDAITLQGIASDIPKLLLFFGTICIVMWGMVDMVTYLQMTISYGSTRRDALIGYVYMNLFEVAGILICMCLVYACVPGEWMDASLEVLLMLGQNVFLIAAALALTFSIFVYRFGKKAYLIFALPVSLLCGGIVGFSSQIGISGIYVSSGLSFSGRLFALNFIGAGLFIIAAVLSFLIMKKLEVRL